jgi:hypothetical protein
LFRFNSPDSASWNASINAICLITASGEYGPGGYDATISQIDTVKDGCFRAYPAILAYAYSASRDALEAIWRLLFMKDMVFRMQRDEISEYCIASYLHATGASQVGT